MIHVRKVLPEYFNALQDGTKRFELRREDPDAPRFAVGTTWHSMSMIHAGMLLRTISTPGAASCLRSAMCCAISRAWPLTM